MVSPQYDRDYSLFTFIPGSPGSPGRPGSPYTGKLHNITDIIQLWSRSSEHPCIFCSKIKEHRWLLVGSSRTHNFQNECLKCTISKSLVKALGTLDVKMTPRLKFHIRKAKNEFMLAFTKREENKQHWFILHAAVSVPYLGRMFNSVPFSTLS